MSEDPYRLPVLASVVPVLCKDCVHYRSIGGLGESQLPDDDEWNREGSGHTFAVCAHASRWKIDPVDGSPELVKAVRCRFKNKGRDCPDFEQVPPDPVSWWSRIFSKRRRARRGKA